MKIRKVIGIILIAIFFMVGCGQKEGLDTSSKEKQSDKKVIIDMSGKKVEVPTNIQKIGDAWPAHNEVVTMLGYGEKIVATILTAKEYPWLYKVNPQMNKSTTLFTKSDVNTEELIKIKPDIVFIPTNYKYADKITSTGIPVVQLNYTNFDELKSCFKITGEVLGNAGKEKADKYISYLDSKLKMVTDVTSKIPKEQKKKVLHINALSPLTIDGSDTIIDSWINAAGGINVAAEVKGNMKQVSIEQILKWNPDVIILQSDIKDADKTLNTDEWKQIAAVQNGKVIRNPNGAFLWDRYGAEEALQIQWAAKLLYPDKFANIDIAKETRNFYKEFLNYDLSEEEANLILSGKQPIK